MTYGRLDWTRSTVRGTRFTLSTCNSGHNISGLLLLVTYVGCDISDD